MKLVARTGKSPEPHPLEAVVCLQVCEAHLNTLSLVSGFGKRLCLHLPSCDVACILMNIARDLARIGRGAALRSYWAHIAVPLRGAVEQRTPIVHVVAPSTNLFWCGPRGSFLSPRSARGRLKISTGFFQQIPSY